MQSESVSSWGLSYMTIVLFVVPGLIGLLGGRALTKLGPAPVSWSLRLRFVREFGWLLVPFAVMGTFGLMAAPHEFLSGVWGATKIATPPQPNALESDADFANFKKEIERLIERNKNIARPEEEVNKVQIPISAVGASDSFARPAWVDQPRLVEGDSERIVLASQQYSTKEEAELELRFAARALVQRDLQQIQTAPFRPVHWRPRDDEVVAHAVKQRYVEVAERDFGSFVHPMYRVWWQIELSPSVRTELLPAWRRELISFRILLVATMASVLAMASSMVVMYFRLDSLTQGQARGELKGLTGLLMAMWLVLAAGAVSQGHLW